MRFSVIGADIKPKEPKTLTKERKTMTTYMSYLIFCVYKHVDDCELLTDALKETVPDVELIFASNGIEAVELLR